MSFYCECEYLIHKLKKLSIKAEEIANLNENELISLYSEFSTLAADYLFLTKSFINEFDMDFQLAIDKILALDEIYFVTLNTLQLALTDMSIRTKEHEEYYLEISGKRLHVIKCCSQYKKCSLRNK